MYAFVTMSKRKAIYNMTKKNWSERESKYDFLRVVLGIFVIAIHTRPLVELEQYKILNYSLLSVLFLCNAIFFMMSGELNLSKTYHSNNEYIDYCKKRLSILFYLLFFIVSLFLWQNKCPLMLHLHPQNY